MADPTLKITDLSTLDPVLVEQTFDELNQIMQEAHPTVELTRGVIHDLVQNFSAIYEAKAQAEVDRVTRSASLFEIEKDPTLADDNIVDRVFSNYRVARKAGVQAAGSITIVVSQDVAVTIENGLIFVANGQEFAADAAFIGRPTGSILELSTDRELQALGDGTFAFTIEATAVLVGEAGNIKRGTQMVPDALPNNFVDAFAATDFINGSDTELNAELLTRLNEGIAAKAWSNRVNISALIKETFDKILTMSIIGYGDAEMARDQHWIWPTSGGGRTDTYIRARALPQEVPLTKTATLVDVTADGGVWQFSIARDDAPGFYEVVSIRLPNMAASTNGFEPSSDARSVDLTGGGFVPDIVSAIEGVYSRYQTSVIKFVDTITPTTGLVVGTATASYSVSVLAMPETKEVQDFVLDRDTGPVAADNLVKAAVPCFMSINFDLRVDAAATTPDVAAISNNLAAYVNNIGFCGQLHASALADVIHNSLVGKAAVGAIDMLGRIRRPDGIDERLRDNAFLEIPDRPEVFTTGRTVVFVLDPSDVGITVVSANFPRI